MLYRCRGGIADFGIEFWLETLCIRTELALPRIHSELMTTTGPVGEEFGTALPSVIAKPRLIVCSSGFLQVLVGGYGGARTTSLQANERPRIELATVRYLRTLEQKEISLHDALQILGTRIKRRRDDLTAYRKQVNDVIKSSPDWTHGDLDTIMKHLKFAQAIEKNDMEIWRRLDIERQSALITIERLQNLLDLEKKKANHNKNKNKNQSARKKELKQDKETLTMRPKQARNPVPFEDVSTVDPCSGDRWLAMTMLRIRLLLAGRIGRPIC
jgi:hypothetical protein